MQVYVDGIGILGPGLEGWDSSEAVLMGKHPYTVFDPVVPELSILPANELRRSTQVVRWALGAAEDALSQAHAKANEVATVFASSEGETGVWDQLCTSLASPERVVSPTLFHHSVHNAAAGYWSIGARSTQPSTSLACFDSSFCGGLLEAASQVMVEGKPVLLVAYDLPPPQPIYAARPLVAAFSVALVFVMSSTSWSKAKLTIALPDKPSGAVTTMNEPRLEALRNGNPAARALPLCAAIAKQEKTNVRMGYLDGNELFIDVTPCQSCQS